MNINRQVVISAIHYVFKRLQFPFYHCNPIQFLYKSQPTPIFPQLIKLPQINQKYQEKKVNPTFDSNYQN